MNIDYQEAINLFVELMEVSLPIGVIWALLERLVEMFYCAVTDRWGRRHD